MHAVIFWKRERYHLTLLGKGMVLFYQKISPLLNWIKWNMVAWQAILVSVKDVYCVQALPRFVWTYYWSKLECIGQPLKKRRFLYPFVGLFSQRQKDKVRWFLMLKKIRGKVHFNLGNFVNFFFLQIFGTQMICVTTSNFFFETLPCKQLFQIFIFYFLGQILKLSSLRYQIFNLP